MEILLISSLILICGVLNRLRGTGLIKHFGILNLFNKKIEIKLVWNHIYAIYIGLVVGLLSMNVYAGLLAIAVYIAGEAKGWGEWIGALTKYNLADEKWLEKQYQDDEGKKFPFIHQISNFFINEQSTNTLFEDRLKQYFRYTTLALILRGIYWWLPVYLVMAYFGVISYVEALTIGISLGLSFPIACKVGKLWNFNKKFGILSFSRGWENQEIVYGLFQGLGMMYIILKVFYGI